MLIYDVFLVYYISVTIYFLYFLIVILQVEIMYKEILIDVILWNEDEPRTVLSRVVSKYKILYILFERFVVWKRKIKHEN